MARVVKSRHARPAPTPAEVLALDAQIERVRGARDAAKSGKARARTSRPSTRAERAKPPTSPPEREVAARQPVDLDTASAATIEALPWVGASLAARIVESRERCGPFGSLEALTRVYGIGAGMSKRLAPHVTFSTPSRPKDAHRTEACSGQQKAPRPTGEAGRE